VLVAAEVEDADGLVCRLAYARTMAEPPIISFGPSRADRSWWALLPSAEVIHCDHVSDLIAAVEQIMAERYSGQPFAFCLDRNGAWEPAAERPNGLHSALAVDW
jgi:hypothetical protein